MLSRQRGWLRRRRTVVVAACLVLATPILASAKLRATLLGGSLRSNLTSQATVGQRDVAAAENVLTRMRGTNAFACELAMINIDHRNWFGGLSNQISDSPLINDSTEMALPEKLDDPAVLDMLLRNLRDPDACVRRAASSLLGRTKAPGAAERLRATLDDQVAETRALAAFALGLGDHQLASERLLLLLADRSPLVRAAAAWSLGRLEYRGAINRLADLLVQDDSPRVRRAAARALGDIAG